MPTELLVQKTKTMNKNINKPGSLKNVSISVGHSGLSFNSNGPLYAYYSIKAENSNAPVCLYNFEVVNGQMVYVGNRTIVPTE